MILTSVFVALLLMIARMSGLFIILPIFGSRNIPAQIKVGLVFFTSYVMLPIIDLQYVQNVDTLLHLAYLIIVEFAIGLMFGMIVVLALGCIYVAGTMIDRNIGFAMVSVINPIGTDQLPVSANLFYIMSLMVFFTIDGHHQLIKTLADTYEFAPVGVGIFNIFGSLELVQIMQEAFIVGFKLASPFVITIFVGNVLLGLLAKAMPGMNVFMLGMPFKIAMGFFLFIILIPSYVSAFVEVFEWIWEEMVKFMVYLKF